MSKIMELIQSTISKHIAWGQNAATLGELDDSLLAVQAEVTRMEQELEAAKEDLQFVERWANHHGAKPHMTAQEALSCIQHYPPILAITKSYADGKVPETRNPWAELEAALKDRVALASENERLRVLLADIRDVALHNINVVAENKDLKAKLAALEAQPVHLYLSPGGNLYATRLTAVQNGEQMLTPLYLDAGAKEKT